MESNDQITKVEDEIWMENLITQLIGANAGHQYIFKCHMRLRTSRSNVTAPGFSAVAGSAKLSVGDGGSAG